WIIYIYIRENFHAQIYPLFQETFFAKEKWFLHPKFEPSVLVNVFKVHHSCNRAYPVVLFIVYSYMVFSFFVAICD
ncbi:hypothetical protein TorRG33x02_303710, partial [Trema orientale]